MTLANETPILDYDGVGDSTYRADFWERGGRQYEDRVERIALEKLLQPATGNRLLELGAGFGRLSAFFEGYQQVIVLDYARSQLEDARSRLGDGKYLYVAADIYRLPIATGACDAATLIRVLHHFQDAPAALRQIYQALSPGALFILEFANKRNLKALLRYALGRQAWNPNALEPIEFVKLHFDFHPDYIQNLLAEIGFQNKRQMGVSYLRVGALKRAIPTGILAGLDSALQQTGSLTAPSVFTQNYVAGQRPNQLPAAIFRCPDCGSENLDDQAEVIACTACGNQYAKVNGIYDFRNPL